MITLFAHSLAIALTMSRSNVSVTSCLSRPSMSIQKSSSQARSTLSKGIIYMSIVTVSFEHVWLSIFRAVSWLLPSRAVCMQALHQLSRLKFWEL